jgi:hypothetical protein
MSEQRNADKDREQIDYMISNGSPLAPAWEVTLHYLERAVSAEQRVAKLEKLLETIRSETVCWGDAQNACEVICRMINEALDRGE